MAGSTPGTGRAARSDLAKFRKPQQRRAIESLERIFLAVEQLVEASGLQEFSMAALARAADLSVGSIYQYFPDKLALMVQVQDRVLGRFEMDARARLGRVMGGLKDVVTACIEVRIENASRHPNLLGTLVLSGMQSPEIIARGRANLQSMEDFFLDAASPFLSEIEHDNPRAALRFCHNMISGLVLSTAWASSESPTPQPQLWTSLQIETTRACFTYLGLR